MRMRKIIENTVKFSTGAVAATLLATMFFAGGRAPAKESGTDAKLSVEQIVEKTNRVAYYQGFDGKSDVTMTIVDSQGRKRNRKLTILRRDTADPDAEDKEASRKKDQYCGEQKFYVYFHRPADVNKTTYLVHKHLDRDDDRWLYLPSLDLIKRIAAGDERTSFVGSHFYYEDVSGRHIDEDKHELVETTDNYYVLKNTPKKPGEVEFAYFKMWIHRKTFINVKTEYYDDKGNKYRQYTAKKVETIQGYPTVTKARMADLRTDGYTDAEYSNIKYDIGLPESIFTQRYLKRPPYEHLK